MKIATAVFLWVALLIPALAFSTEAGNANPADTETVVVSGIGYPPIKAENPAQARLMARRAAILDAYRNAPAAAGNAHTDEQTFYTGLSGFVKGLTIEKEEYLEDGSVRITARVPGKSGAPSARAVREGMVGRSRGGPSPVPLNDWYRIIERSVRYE